MPDGALGGALALAASTAVLALGIAVVAYAGEIWTGVRRALQALAPPRPVPTDVPIQRIVSDMRRLRVEADHRAGEPMARHRGVVAAYDSALTDACRMPEVDTDLTELPEGTGP